MSRHVHVSHVTCFTPQVVKVSATDEDSGVNSDISYAIVSGNADAHFRIDADSGQVTLAKPLDRETTPRYELVVAAVDKGVPDALNATAVVSITVMDYNDNAPVFTQNSAALRRAVAEDAPPGTFVLPVSATDDDLGNNAQLQYAISGGNERTAFSIDSATGRVYVATPLDYETRTRSEITPPICFCHVKQEKKMLKFYLVTGPRNHVTCCHRYELTIVASDYGSPRLSSSVTCTIDVTDVNDHAPTFTSSPLVRQVVENSAVGTIVGTVTATDPDQGACVCEVCVRLCPFSLVC